MTVVDSPDDPLDRLLGKIDVALVDGHMESNKRAFALIALGLCTIAYDVFSDDQKQAIRAARRWLLEGDDRDRAYWGDLVSAGIRMGQPLSASDRIIFGALNPAGLDGYGGESLAYLAADIGLNPAQIASVFSEHIPGFNPKL